MKYLIDLNQDCIDSHLVPLLVILEGLLSSSDEGLIFKTGTFLLRELLRILEEKKIKGGY